MSTESRSKSLGRSKYRYPAPAVALIRIMSYYDNQQWSGPGQNNWEHQSGTSTPVRSAGASAPQPQDEFAFSYQFDEVDRAFENLSKSGKGYGMGGRREFPKTADQLAGARPQANRRGGLAHVVRAPTNQAAPPAMRVDSRVSHGGGPRSHHMNAFDDAPPPALSRQQRGGAGYAGEEKDGSPAGARAAQPPHGAAIPTNCLLVDVLTDVAQQSGKHMSEEETRELIARQRSALYGEGPFADKSGYVDETGNMRPGAPVASGPASLRGPSPLTFDNIGRAPSGAEIPTPGSASDHAQTNPSPRPQSTTSPQTAGPTNKAFENAVGPQSRTSNSSPTGGSPPRDLAPGSKPGQAGAPLRPSAPGHPARRRQVPLGSGRRRPSPPRAAGAAATAFGASRRASGLKPASGVRAP
ncbi:hypothetical protein ACCO45_002272 [Purpureocillium lilacinum]|uniref:Uncharacterized protein n=1 Tax=Purpureocillium lilacinum TaxID=33203 RepID=A0ACC4EAQ1_PURLI